MWIGICNQKQKKRGGESAYTIQNLITGNALHSTSNFWMFYNTSIRSNKMEVRASTPDSLKDLTQKKRRVHLSRRHKASNVTSYRNWTFIRWIAAYRVLKSFVSDKVTGVEDGVITFVVSASLFILLESFTPGVDASPPETAQSYWWKAK